MKCRTANILWLILLLALNFPVNSGSLLFGINLEFVEARFNGEGVDGGFGVHLGYEFKEWEDWHFGGLFEMMNGWYGQDELGAEGDMMYSSRSLFATARPDSWPIILKAGLVNADYKILEDSTTRDFREVSNTGHAYGVGLILGKEDLQLNLLDYKRIKIGSDSFSSFGFTLVILFD